MNKVYNFELFGKIIFGNKEECLNYIYKRNY